MRVFVYGTLMRGQRNHPLMRGASYLGIHRTSPAYTMFGFDDFPAVSIGGRQAIHGEVFEINRCLLDRLDRLEGHPHFYRRIGIATDHGEAWMYVVRREACRGRPRLSCGWPGQG